MSDGSVRTISGATGLAAVIGAPVRHSLSPAIFNAAFAAAGVDCVFVALEVGAGQARVAMEAFRAMRWKGMSVTMPHKSDISGLVDRLTPVAARLGAVNSVSWSDGSSVGDSTDGAGFIDSLREAGMDAADRRCLVLGAGGAARAVVLALAEAGAGSVVVVNRTAEAGERAAALAPGLAQTGQAEEAEGADLIVNATPIGMGTDPNVPLDASLLRSGQVVVDLVYHPSVTPLLQVATSVGATTVGGLGMLVHQAAHQFRHWTGQDAPLEVMWAAARAGVPPSRFSG
jgi:shikimate dehydrogenase